MYEEFYNFEEKPFSLLPDPGFLYLTKKHRMALTMLQYGLINQAGFTVVVGEIGAGKTTLVRQLLKDVDQDVTIGLVSNTHGPFSEVMQWILLAFNLDYRGKDKVELFHAFAEFMIEEYTQNRRTVLIIDEAQNLSPEALEELRMLSNINADKDQLLQLILIGQPGLKDTLGLPQLQQFAQRVAVDYYLGAMDVEETWGYIQHRVSIAGGSPDLFDTRACAAVHYYARGVPRLVNVLCDAALVFGYAEERERIDAELVCRVVRDRSTGGIFGRPGASPPAAPAPLN
ncbi:AAA family ATPase [Ectothiorhodospiraceae bacterium 2226]|nr:AAA family ATPase [Ectothiorhodospiraceae bacterium 2226]